MKNIRLKVENVSKQYRLGEVGTGTLSHDINRWWARIRGKEDPFAQVGATNDRTIKTDDDYVWALKDINFELNEGEVLGVIGRNGAGKSTLLKVLSKVTGPTSGQIKINGRIGSLLEVGTGMHPELTGIENIYLNGAILGMKKPEIASKIDEIIDFAGIAKYADTPFKRYSSGMRVRLGFAVAVFLDTEILIVDEVLAVGDIAFQKQAIDKMKEITQETGRTILFVSHNMASVKALCKRGIVLENGKIILADKIDKCISHYLTLNEDSSVSLMDRKDRRGNQKLSITSIDFLNDDSSVNEVISCEPLTIRFHFKKNHEVNFDDLFFGVSISDRANNRIASFFSDEIGTSFSFLEHQNYIDLEINNFFVRGGTYNVTYQLSVFNTEDINLIDSIANARELLVLPGDLYGVAQLNRSYDSSIFPAKFN